MNLLLLTISNGNYYSSRFTVVIVYIVICVTVNSTDPLIHTSNITKQLLYWQLMIIIHSEPIVHHHDWFHITITSTYVTKECEVITTTKQTLLLLLAKQYWWWYSSIVIIMMIIIIIMIIIAGSSLSSSFDHRRHPAGLQDLGFATDVLGGSGRLGRCARGLLCHLVSLAADLMTWKIRSLMGQSSTHLPVCV